MGAVPGALLRWQINDDFIVNIFGTFVFGYLLGFQAKKYLQVMIGLGFCASLTTFSGWIAHILNLLLEGFFLNALKVVFFTLIFGILSFFVGLWVGKTMKKLKFPCKS